MPFWEIIIIIQWWSEWPGRLCELQSDWEFTKAGGRDGSRWPFEFDAPSPPHRLFPSCRKQFHVYNSTFLS